jgi:hypothetical protein
MTGKLSDRPMIRAASIPHLGQTTPTAVLVRRAIVRSYRVRRPNGPCGFPGLDSQSRPWLRRDGEIWICRHLRPFPASQELTVQVARPPRGQKRHFRGRPWQTLQPRRFLDLRPVRALSHCIGGYGPGKSPDSNNLGASTLTFDANVGIGISPTGQIAVFWLYFAGLGDWPIR